MSRPGIDYSIGNMYKVVIFVIISYSFRDRYAMLFIPSTVYDANHAYFMMIAKTRQKPPMKRHQVTQPASSMSDDAGS